MKYECDQTVSSKFQCVESATGAYSTNASCSANCSSVHICAGGKSCNDCCRTVGQEFKCKAPPPFTEQRFKKWLPGSLLKHCKNFDDTDADFAPYINADGDCFFNTETTSVCLEDCDDELRRFCSCVRKPDADADTTVTARTFVEI